MDLKRYNWRIVTEKKPGDLHKKTLGLVGGKKLVGYRIRLYFKSVDGYNATMDGKLIPLSKIKTKDIEKPAKGRFFKRRSGFSKEFIEEIWKHNPEMDVTTIDCDMNCHCEECKPKYRMKKWK